MKPIAYAIALIVSAALAGCEPAPIYQPDPQAATVGTVTPRTQWSVTGTMSDADLACDGKIETAATGSGRPSLIIDLGKPCTFNFIVVDHGSDREVFARRVQIATSMDGQRFSSQLVGPGMRRVSNFLMRRPVLARFVQITAIEAGPEPWSVAEVHLQ